MADAHLERLALNQATMRIANERLTAWPERRRVDDAAPLTFFCECADPGCREKLVLTRGEYEDIRRDSRLFPIAKGHEYPDVDRVAEERDDYAVVEKVEDVADVLTATDPRS